MNYSYNDYEYDKCVICPIGYCVQNVECIDNDTCTSCEPKIEYWCDYEEYVEWFWDTYGGEIYDDYGDWFRDAYGYEAHNDGIF